MNKKRFCTIVLGSMLLCFSLCAMEQEKTNEIDSIQHSSLIVTLAHYLIRNSIYGLQATTSAGYTILKSISTRINKTLMALNSPVNNDELIYGENYV